MKKLDEIIENIKFGVDYYPEHWPEERWETDAELMEKDGNPDGENGRVFLAQNGTTVW